MDESTTRMTDPGTPPTESAVAGWVGENAYKYWKLITQSIEQSYPGVFAPEWLFGGRKHGWAQRYKKSKSFCTLIPEKGRFSLLIVFGAEEREKVDAIRKSLSKNTQREYDEATTYHDGKWLLLAVDSDTVVKDVTLLLSTKRKPKNCKEA